MSFTSKNLQSHKGGMTFLKGATFFFLGMSLVMFMTKAFEITPSTINTSMFLRNIILTQDGSSSSTVWITFDWSGGVVEAKVLSGETICIGSDCETSRPSGWTATLPWGPANAIQFSDGTGFSGTSSLVRDSGNWRLWVWISTPSEKFQVSNFSQIGRNITPLYHTWWSFFRLVWGTTSMIACMPWNPCPYYNANIQLNNDFSSIPHKWRISNDWYLNFWYTTNPAPDGYDTFMSIRNDGSIKLSSGAVIHSTSSATSNQIFLAGDTAGNVGIGTNNPSEKLEVNGKVKVGSNLKLSSSSTYGIIESSSWLWFNTSGNALPKMVIDTAGNVGIGIPSPSAKLDVNGRGKFADSIQIWVEANWCSDTSDAGKMVYYVACNGTLSSGTKIPVFAWCVHSWSSAVVSGTFFTWASRSAWCLAEDIIMPAVNLQTNMLFAP